MKIFLALFILKLAVYFSVAQFELNSNRNWNLPFDEHSNVFEKLEMGSKEKTQIRISLERHLFPPSSFSSLLSFCNIILFTEKELDLDVEETERPLVLISGSNMTSHPIPLTLTSSCNVLSILINLSEKANRSASRQKFFKQVKTFLVQNFASIQKIGIFLRMPPNFNQTEQPGTNYRKYTNGIRKDTVVVELSDENPEGIIKRKFRGFPTCPDELSRAITMTQPYDLKCILRGREVGAGFSEINPYFMVKKWGNETSGAQSTNMNMNANANDTISRILKLNRENIGEIRGNFNGIETEMLKLLVEVYSMTFILYQDVYGWEDGNGRWSGKIGLLQQGKVDMIAGALPGNYRRGQVGDHSAPLHLFKFSLSSHRPKLLPSYLAPLRPFPFTAWLILALSVALVGPFIWFLTKLEFQLDNEKKREGKTKRELRKFNMSLVTVCGRTSLTLLSEPWIKPPQSRSAYMVLSSYFIACTAIQCFYASNLITSFSIPEFEREINTLQDTKDLHKILVVKRGTTPSLFIPPGENAFRVVNTTEESEIFSDESKVTPLDASIFMMKVISRGLKTQDFYTAKPFLSIFAGYLYSREFNLKEGMNIAILRVRQAGLTEKWKEWQFRNVSIRDGLMKSGWQNLKTSALEHRDNSLSMMKLQALFYFWITGMILGFLAFILEMAAGFYIQMSKVESKTE